MAHVVTLSAPVWGPDGRTERRGRTGSPPFNRRLALLLAMAMFVLVVDTSLMNVSISAVVGRPGATVSGVQSAIALEALVSAAFILIGGKVADLIGRKRGLRARAVRIRRRRDRDDARADLGARHHLLGGRRRHRRRAAAARDAGTHPRQLRGRGAEAVYALVGAAAAIAAAVGPLLGGFLTTTLSWRAGFLLEAVVIAVVLPGSGWCKDVPYSGPRQIDLVGALLSVLGMGGLVLGILVWQEGGEAVAPFSPSAWSASARWSSGSRAASAAGEPTLVDPDLFASEHFRLGHLRPDAPADRSRRRDDHPPDLPADGAGVQRAGGRPLPRAAVAEHVRRLRCWPDARLQTGAPAASSGGASLLLAGLVAGRPGGAARRLRLGSRAAARARRVGARAAGLPAEQLHAGPDRRGSGQRGGRGELGRGLLRALVRPGVRGCDHAGGPVVRLHRDGRGQHGAAAGGPGPGRSGPRGRRAGHEQHQAGAAARRRATGDQCGDRADQHRGTPARAPDRPPGAGSSRL